jgi:hypothetical protein
MELSTTLEALALEALERELYFMETESCLLHLDLYGQLIVCYVGFEVFTAVTMKCDVPVRQPLLTLSFARGCFVPRRRRRNFPPKFRFLQDPHGATFQQTSFFKLCAVCEEVKYLELQTY